jgi:hypothetical protein
MLWCAWLLALASAGSSKLARIAMMAITTSNSINVKPLVLFVFILTSCLRSVFRGNQSPRLVKSQPQIPVAQPMNLRRIQRHHAHCPALVTGPDQTKQHYAKQPG